MRYKKQVDEENTNVDIGSLKRILPFFKEFKKSIFLSVLAVMVATILGAILPLVFRHIIDVVLPSKDMDQILKVGLIYFLILFLSVATSFIQELVVGYMGIEIVSKIKKDLLKHIFTLAIDFFDNVGMGKLISRIESDSQQLFMLFSSVGLQILWAFLSIMISFGVMFYTSKTLTLYVLVIMPVYFLGSFLVFKKMRPMFRTEREIYAKITGLIGEYLKAIPTLRNMGNISWSQNRLKTSNQQKLLYAVKIHIIQSSVWFVLLITPNIIISIILYKSVSWIRLELITIGTVWMFIQYIMNSIHPLIIISEQIGEIQKSLGASDRIFEIFDTIEGIPNPDIPLALNSFNSKIEFKNVNFSYVEGEEVLKNISFEINKGEKIAIVGATGSGKTTIISLLARFYDVLGGEILIDGINIKKINKNNLRSFFGIVLQDIYLFPGNIVDNIRVFRKDISEKKVIESLQAVKAMRFIESLPTGIHSLLAEDGGNFSYGERQLLSFARALAFSPDILILDEATSSVDPRTEYMIQQALNELLKGRTSIIVAHRLSTIINADKIIVIDNGEIKECGNHNDLIDLNGIYAGYYYKQLNENGVQNMGVPS